jgi:LmbE family N-acetylglucosaminyl deacetylase
VALGPVAPAARALIRTAIRLAGRDVTRETATRSCVVLAPHGDDETLGCGANIARKRRTGTAVRVLVATDGRNSAPSVRMKPDELARIRASEVIQACAVLGVPRDDVILLDHEDGALSAIEDDMTDRIADLLETVRPDEIYTTAVTDPHPDHAALGRATLRATAGSGIDVLTYPVWQWPALRPWVTSTNLDIEGGVCTVLPAWRSRPLLVRSGEYQATKRKALAAHESQLRNITGEPGWPTLGADFLRYFFRSHEPFFPVLLA